MHVRTQIRNSFATLVTGLATTGSNVYKTRLYPFQSDNLPGLAVSVESEEVDDEEGKNEQLQHRDAMVVVSGYDKLVAGLDDQLDTISAEVETAVFADRFLSGLLMSLDLVSTETELVVDQEKPLGEITLTFRARYFTSEGAPETVI